MAESFTMQGVPPVRRAVNDVFEPRRADVNQDIYVTRPELERRLSRALQGALNVIVYGESGVGKSWLCKRVLSEIGAFYVTANCARAATNKSITAEIFRACVPVGELVQSNFTQGGSASAGLFGLGAGVEAERGYKVVEPDQLVHAYERLRKDAGDKPAFVVLDNLERIFSDKELMRELGNIITLLDDSSCAKHKIRLLIVGTESDVRNYFAKTDNLRTIGNRVEEIPEIRGLNRQQVKSLISQGFRNLLLVDVSDELLDSWATYIHRITLGIPQYVHEYCRCLGFVCEDHSWQAKQEFLSKADSMWMNQSLREAYQVVESHMNQNRTVIQRKNQAIYAIGCHNGRSFSGQEIEQILRSKFPGNTNGTTLNVSQVLSELSRGPNPLVKQTPLGNAYEMANPRYLMCLRVMLYVQDERVHKVDAEQISD